MINDLDIVQWGYLLDPAFQLVNSAGKPLTNGYIEVYYHGTRTKYYCASDFDGTLHPFKIPLDSLGSNIVLADPSYAYDVYIYNSFGSLVMSRYNVTPGNAGGEGGGPVSELPEHWLGMYGASIQIPGTGAGTTLPVPASGSVDYEGDFIDHIEDNKYIYLKEGLYLVECVIRFEQSSYDLKNELGEVLVYTGRGNANEDQAWQEDLSGPDANGNRHCLKMSFIRLVQEGTHHGDSSVLYFAPGVYVNWSWAQIQNLSIVKLGTGAGGAALKYVAGDYITINDRVISVTGLQPVSAMGDYVTNDTFNTEVTNIYNDVNNVTSIIEGDIYNEIQNVTSVIEGDIHQEITNVTSVVDADLTYVSSAIDAVSAAVSQIVSGQEYEAGEGIIIEDHVISIDPAVTGEISLAELEAVSGQLEQDIQTVSAALPDAQVNSDWNATEGKAEILNKPDLSVYATHNEVATVSGTIINNVTGDIQNVTSVIEQTIETVSGTLDDKIEAVSAAVPEAQVQSDWTEDDAASKAYIQHKPTIKNMVAGDNISITVSGDSVVIAASGDVTEEDIATVSGQLEQDIQTVSAAIPAAQVNSDWNANSGVAEILNKPDLTVYATHDEVASVSSNIEGDISAVTTVIMNTVEGVSATIEGDIQSVSTTIEGDIQYVSGAVQDAVTRSELETVSGALENDIQTVSAAIPDAQVNADWNATSGKAEILNKPDLSVYATNQDLQVVSAAIPDISNLATEADLQTVSAAIPDISNLATETEVQTVSAAIDYVSGAIPEAQVNADWNSTSGKSEILNKPDLSVYATNQDLQAVSAAIPDVSDLATEADLQTVSAAIPDVSNFATEAELQTVSAAIPDVSNFVTETELETVSGNLEQDIQIVSAAIVPYTQVQSDWTEAVTSDPAYIKNKPTSTALAAGHGIIIEEVSGSVVISASADPQVNSDWDAVSGAAMILNKPGELPVVAGTGITITEDGVSIVISADGSAVTGDVSKAELAAVSGALNTDIQTVSAAIPDISNLATEAELQTVSAAIPEEQELVAGQGISITISGNDVVISATGGGGDVTMADLVAVSGNLEGDIQTVSAAIPDTSNLATRSEVNTVSGVLEGDIQTVSAGIPDVSIYATESDLQTVSGDVLEVSAMIGDVETLLANL